MSKGDLTRVYVGLGSNLEQPLQQIKQALQELDEIPRSRCLKRSSLYRSPPLGPPDQPEYINAVAELETTLEPEILLDQLQRIEQQHGRRREGERWGPRTLDLDLLLFGDRQLATSRLTVPHPGLCERAFVLYPLAEIAGFNLKIPGNDTLAEVLSQVSDAGLAKIDE